MYKSIALSAYPSLPTFLRRRSVCANFDVRLSVPVVWVGQRPKELYHVMLQLTTKLNWRSAFPPNGVAVGLHAEKTDEVKPLYCNRYFTNYWM